MRLSIVKPIGAKWIIAMSDYIKSHPEMIINGFKNVGLKTLMYHISSRTVCHSLAAFTQNDNLYIATHVYTID